MATLSESQYIETRKPFSALVSSNTKNTLNVKNPLWYFGTDWPYLPTGLSCFIAVPRDH